MSLMSEQRYEVIDTPPASQQVLDEFEYLPFDPYTGDEQRYRRFSQYSLAFNPEANRWELKLLPHRPFIQAPSINSFVGGVERHFEPLRIDPGPQIKAGAQALELDRDETWQVNVHQCRVVANNQGRGVSVPEGPHRDGHDYGMLAVFQRHNITGGENELMPTGGGEPFFRVTLQPNQALVYEDPAMWHNATDIEALDSSGGFRDLWIVAFNRWENRKYGDDFERQAKNPET